MTSTPATKQTALITGASSGIGADLARLFARGGYDLVLTARGEDALETLAKELREKHGATVDVVPADLGKPGGADGLVERLGGRQVDVLVNNAGIGQAGPFVELGGDGEAQMLELNMIAPTRLTRLLLPGMIERGSGRIMNVASTAAFQPGPLMAGYYATKAYLLSLSEALAEELRGSGVTVTALCPGPTATGFQERAEMTETRLAKSGMMSSMAVARAGYAGMRKGKPLVVPGFRNKVLIGIVRVWPRSLVRRVVRRMNARPGGH